MSETIAKKSLRPQIAERVRDGLCLQCGRKGGRRGLCQNHYRLFRLALLEKPIADRAAFEEAQIRDGQVLATLQVREITDPNPFKSNQWPKAAAEPEEGAA